MSQAIIGSWEMGLMWQNAADLRKLADELVNSSIVLSYLSNEQEVESQWFITSVIERLQPFLKEKWKKIAMERKHKEGMYPGFNQLD